MTDGKDPGRRPATPVSRTPRVLGGVLALAACLALCVLSCPAVGRLPERLFLPCLGLGAAALAILLYTLLRGRRGH